MNIFQKYTVKTLKRNQVRTIVTMIGIILSLSMLTAITTLISSLHYYLREEVIENEGNWHAALIMESGERYESLSSDEDVKQYTYMQLIGSARLEESQNEDKPYLSVFGIADNFETMMPVHLLEGRMPENETEIIVPQHLRINGGVKYEIGQVIELNVGQRTDEAGEWIYENDPYDPQTPEELNQQETKIYTVVGVYERPEYEDYMSGGYTALTKAETGNSIPCDYYIQLKNEKNSYDFLEQKASDSRSKVNLALLRTTAASGESSYNSVLYGLGGILIGIIVFASISLIYNAFSISVSERTRQFGILSSVGATRRQLTKSVLYEALSVSVVGIPLGIGAGLLGIWVTLRLCQNILIKGIGGEQSIAFVMRPSVLGILVAMAIGALTVLISSLIPAVRATRISAIDAIRQTKDIAISPRKVRTSRLTYSLFGFEGMIASKNFKRNRKQYRATVVSLFVSVVLFISASSFCVYLDKSMNDVLSTQGYDLNYTYVEENKELSPQESQAKMQSLYELLSGVPQVGQSGYLVRDYQYALVDASQVSEEYLDFLRQTKENQTSQPDQKQFLFGMRTFYIQDDLFDDYVKKIGLNVDDYHDQSRPLGVMVDQLKLYYGEDQRFYTSRVFRFDQPKVMDLKEKQSNLDADCYFEGTAQEREDGTLVGNFSQWNEEDSQSTEQQYPLTEQMQCTEIAVGSVQTNNNLPIGVSVDSMENVLLLLYPYSQMSVTTDGDQVTEMYFKASDDHVKLNNDLAKLITDEGYDSQALYDAAERDEVNRALYLIVKIFSYGFIVLISLIAGANVFHTISTNIQLRRREFAMLRSVGMTRKSFNRMMNYECLLYGIKGLLYGIPVSVVVTYFIYRSILSGLELNFFIPVSSIVIAVGSVFLVVFATMLYAMSKVRKQNTIDILKNENI